MVIVTIQKTIQTIRFQLQTFVHFSYAYRNIPPILFGWYINIHIERYPPQLFTVSDIGISRSTV